MLSRPSGNVQVHGGKNRCVFQQSRRCSLAAIDPARQCLWQPIQHEKKGSKSMRAGLQLQFEVEACPAASDRSKRYAVLSSASNSPAFRATASLFFWICLCVGSFPIWYFRKGLCNSDWSLTVARHIAGTYAPPTVTQTKIEFRNLNDKPINAIYEPVLQELLVQQHFMRYNIKYKYDPVRSFDSWRQPTSPGICTLPV